MELLVPRADLFAALADMVEPDAAHQQGVAIAAAAVVYSHGFEWKLSLSLHMDTEELPPRVELCPVLECKCVSSSEVLAGCTLSCTVQRAQPLSAITLGWPDLLVDSQGARLNLFQSLLPIRQDFLNPARWEHFILDDSLRVTMTISDIC